MCLPAAGGHKGRALHLAVSTATLPELLFSARDGMLEWWQWALIFSAAFLVGLMIGRMAIKLGLSALKNLIDESLPAEKKGLVEKVVLQYREVKGISFMHTRRVGQQAWIEQLAGVQFGPARSLAPDGEFGWVGTAAMLGARIPEIERQQELTLRAVSALRQRHLQP